MILLYEKLVAKYQDEVTIREEKMPYKLPGLYLNGVILINKNQSSIEKGCILAEELMHYKYTVGNITKQETIMDKKQELFARRKGYEAMVPLEDIITCFYLGLREYFEVADFLEVTEEFLRNTVTHYAEKYGPMYDCGEYLINFGSAIDVYKKF
ncbi:Domain of uncharacterised function (DUF955) [Listeria ivanovii subsp. londoniensis]|uniref:IrrE N-terminal-like domain-containing protein n=1 Tax=Listeria ivanovii TaxID=1638 RepID=A0AAX2DLG4_LISIV|nr:protein of unknown function [Listeria ivanovii]VEH44559.1 Domain of uncharacterised function (DUF955) [Listeria ivanovii subsp. londoniensis]